MEGKRFYILALVCSFFVLTPWLASAALVYEQTPISWSHHTNNFNRIADDFKLDQTTRILNVEWWGANDTTDTYEIHFYQNQYDGTNGNWEPGAPAGSFTRTVGKTLYSGSQYFIFSADIDFIAAAGQFYWINIRPVGASGWTGWRPASSPVVSYFEQYTRFISGDWEPYTTDPDYHHDLAFRLSGAPVPVPGSLLILGSGLAGLLGGIRRRNGYAFFS